MKKVFAYCAYSFASTVRQAAGVVPMTCPPVSAVNIEPYMLEGYDLLYFDLHGEPGDTCWRGDDGIVALTAEQILDMNLRGSVVFAVNCYLADMVSPMLGVLLTAGAKYVIAGDGENYAGERTLFGANLLGLWFRRLFVLGIDPLRALPLAKKRVRLDILMKSHVKSAKDTLAFRAYCRRK